MAVDSTPTPKARRPPPLVFLRDFAYPDNAAVLLPAPMRAARDSISRSSARTFAELLSGTMVDIYVGPKRKHWSLHRNLLCHHSSYFETEFQGHEVPKKEEIAGHNTLELPDDDPRGFELLVKWLYQGNLEETSHMTDEAKYEYAVACHKLYQLCDKFDMILVKNLAMDAYRSNLHAAQLVPDADEINEIYRASPPESPFRTLMTKIAARQIMDPGVDKDAESYRPCFEDNPHFAVEMVNAIRTMSGGMLFDDPTKEEDCKQWHDHRDGSRCHDQRKTENVVYVDKGSSSTPFRRQAPLLQLAELSERPTPRKLNVPPHTPVASSVSSSKRTPSGLANGVKATPSRRAELANSTASKPTQNGGQEHTTAPPDLPNTGPGTAGLPMKPMAIRSHPKPHLHPNGVAHRPVSSPRKLRQNGPTPANPRKEPNGVPSDEASSVASAPRRPNHVNGITQQFEGMNGTNSDSRHSSMGDAGDAADKQRPPKLKRKAPG